MYLIIDVGATYTKYAYYQKEHYIKGDKYPTEKSGVADFYERIKELTVGDVEKISISMPGIIENGFVHAISLLPFLSGHDVQSELQKLLNVEVLVENDARCAALGEMWQGSLKGASNAMMMVLGSGIGGTLIMNGHIIDSSRHKAGEIGSILMPLDQDYLKMTNFGRHNNANKLIEKVAARAQIEKDGETVFAYLQNHKNEVFEKYCRQIAFMIYNLDYILDLDVVAIGGGISEQKILIEQIDCQYQWLRDQYEEDRHRCLIVACHHGNHANILGALSRLLDK